MRVLWLVKGLGAGGTERLLALSVRLTGRTAIGSRLVQREAGRRSPGVGPDEVLIGTVANLPGTKAYPDLVAAVFLSRATPAAGYVPLPHQGPILTWRAPATTASDPPLDGWELSPGDIELL